jgi:hypothetical protein
VNVYEFATEDGTEATVVEVLSGTRTVAGVQCRRVRDRVYLDGVLIEDTEDWYAQDDAQNVWYMGEDVDNYHYDAAGVLTGITHEGSWEAGQDIATTGTNATAGIIMKGGTLVVGDEYAQEIYPTVAMDMARIVALNVPLTLRDGTAVTCVKTREWNPLEAGSAEFKYFAPGIGLVAESSVDGSEFNDLKAVFLTGLSQVPSFAAAVFTTPTVIDNSFLPMISGTSREFREDTDKGEETIIVAVLNQTRVVNGVTCRVVRDTVYLNGRIVEDTLDWFAQDDAGNVWYMGESVENYDYDAAGNFLSVTNEGSWEAGVAGALPGIAMRNSPVARTSYYQEYAAGIAEDMGFVVATGKTVTGANGTVYTGCVQILDWVPLDPSHLEYKFYAPGVGLVLETDVSELPEEKSSNQSGGCSSTESSSLLLPVCVLLTLLPLALRALRRERQRA